jgi:Asp-tRNA(Asn)/Glu-tRNA(Gln) amidotransferase A subunit family amidase
MSHRAVFLLTIVTLTSPLLVKAETNIIPQTAPQSSDQAKPVPAALSAADIAAMDKDLLEITIPQLEDLYASHKYTVTQVVQWYLARIQKYNGIYMAVQTLNDLEALKVAAQEDAAYAAGNIQRGPMWGVPIVTKANTSVRGLITTDGWRGYKIPGHELVAPKDATIVARLKAAGAIILGQTNMPDFAASDTNRSTAFGRTGNAYDVRFSPGGSSGGTVTAVTSNYVMLGNGTDTANSIRMPAATSAVIGVFPLRASRHSTGSSTTPAPSQEM